MRRDLLLLRHAKSAWNDPSLSDHDRPLAPRGETAVRRIRDHFVRAGYRPDVVLCSSARRTVDTLEGIRTALPKRTTIGVSDELYLADVDTLLTRLHRLDKEIRCAVFIGH
ncbi:MAG TPA: histidine phosphatase family protein, partial [Ilumatobacteraceae bacterium]